VARPHRLVVRRANGRVGERGDVPGWVLTTGSLLVTQDSPGVPGSAELDDVFGYALAVGDFGNNGFVDLAVGVPGEDVGPVMEAGAANVVYGAAGGLSSAGASCSQDSPGVPGTAEGDDLFAEALAASGPQRAAAPPASPSRSGVRRAAPR
jgi:FG-GAP repeat